jgi:hypothetical protein
MARRPDPVEFDHPLAKGELQALARRLGLLSQPGLIDAYRRGPPGVFNAGRQCAARGGNAGDGYRVEADAGVGEAANGGAGVKCCLAPP